MNSCKPYPETVSDVFVADGAVVCILTAGETQRIRFCFTEQLDTVRQMTHPAIKYRTERVYECCAGEKPNRRYWQEDGVEIAVDVPRRLIQLVPVCGYSYPKLKVAGVDVTLNVTGGTSPRRLQPQGAEWCDFIYEAPHTRLNHPLATLQTVLDAVCPL